MMKENNNSSQFIEHLSLFVTSLYSFSFRSLYIRHINNMGNSKSTGSFLEMKRLEEVTGIPRQQFIDMHEETKRKSGDEKLVLVDRS